MPYDITHSRARCQRWWCWLFHPSRCPTSSPWGRSSGPCSSWSWLLPAESLRATHIHINSERQIASQAWARPWLIPPASAADSLRHHTQTSYSSCFTDSWAVKSTARFPAPHITAAAVTYAVKAWHLRVGVRAPTGWTLICSPTSLCTHNNWLTSCVPVRWVRPSSWRPCSPSFR